MPVSDIIIRIVFAICVGGFIGYEREMRNRPAGFITHTLVCVGACVVSLIQIQMVQDTIIMIEEKPILAQALKADVGRVVAQVITGVGFLGAGTIIFDKGSVKGLTTATTIWVVACIGLSIGLGYYTIAIISTIGIGFVVLGLRQFEEKARNRKFMVKFEIVYKTEDDTFIESSMRFFKKHRVQIRDIRFVESKRTEEKTCQLVLYFGFVRDRNKIMEKFLENESILTLTKIG